MSIPEPWTTLACPAWPWPPATGLVHRPTGLRPAGPGQAQPGWPALPAHPEPLAKDNPAVSVEHYENFPVASILCPPALRPAVTAIYHFARTADDLADEGDASPAQRLGQLAAYRQALLAACQGPADADPAAWPAVFVPLGAAIRRHALPVALLQDLLTAFEQDTGNPTYPDRTALLAYCGLSANPVGRLMLHLAGVHDAKSLAESDALCSALQLINFWQDPSVDLPRGRVYLPLDDARRHGVVADATLAGSDTPATQALLCELCQWAGDLMHQGAPLACRLPGRLGWELRLVVQGGLRILETIAAMQYCTLGRRPTLRTRDLAPMLWRALRMREDRPTPGLAAR